MTVHPTPIDAAIEQVVKAGSDPEQLHAAVSVLADLMGSRLVAKTDEDALPLILHGSHGGSVRQVDGNTVYVAPCGYYAPTMSMTGLYSAINCPGCVEALSDDDSGNESDAEPKPCHGDHGTCAVCGNGIDFYGIADLEGYGARWMHEQGTADGHDAVLGSLA